MAWTALALVLIGIVYAFGVRSYLAWRATGDTGLRIAAGPFGSATWWAKLLFIVSILLLIAGPVTALAAPDLLLWQADPAVQVTGLAVAAVGMLIVTAAQHGMGASWRIGVDRGETTGLVTGGLFSLARNPIFVGMAVSATGIALVTPNHVSVAAAAVLIAAVQLQVRAVEEPYLLAAHGHAYLHYAARTGRFLPGIGKLRDPGHHEHGPPRQA